MKKRRTVRRPNSSRGFSADPQTAWRLTPNSPDRNMQLLADFSFNDGAKIWHAAQGEVVDGASIPRALWSLVGSPYTGYYRRASIVHDIACVEAGNDARKRLLADKMFYRACRVGGCSVWQATLLYIGVRIGAYIGEVDSWRLAEAATTSAPRLARTASEENLERDFRAIAESVLAPGEVDNVDEIERRFQQRFSALVRR